MGLEENNNKLQHFGVHWGSVNSLQPWQLIPEEDPSHVLPDGH